MQLLIGKRGLRILVQHARVRAGRRGVEVVIKLLDVLAVIALLVRQPKEPLFQDGIFAIPQSDGEAKCFFFVAETGNPVLAPAIGAAAGMVVRKVIPRRTVRAVIFADRSPLALAKVRSPAAPGLYLALGFIEAILFGVCWSLRLGWIDGSWHCLSERLQQLRFRTTDPWPADRRGDDT